MYASPRARVRDAGGRDRARTLRVVLVVAAAVILVRMFQVQVIEHGRWTRAAAAVQERVLELAPRRGAIYDRNETLLAFDVKAMAIAIDSFNMTRPVELCKILAQELSSQGLSMKDIEKIVYRQSYFTWVSRTVDLATARRIRERAEEAGAYGLIFLDAWKRHYPQGQLASNVIGFVGADGAGLEGLELQYDELLRGLPTIVHIVQGADGRTYESRVVDEGKPGQDLHLTLDADLQLLCEEEIARSAAIYNPLGGFAIVVNPNTGEVLAMAQDKTYDLNRFSRSTLSQRQNLAVTLMFEPGSIFKAISGLSALEAGVVTADTLLQGKDGILAGGHTIHNAGRESFGAAENGYKVTFRKVIEKSINTGIVDAVLRLKKEPLHQTMSALGFGSPTGIDLPGEASGILRPVQQWTDVELATSAFGQSVGVTGIQLARGLSAIANGGYLVTPHVVMPVEKKKRKGDEVPPLVVSAAACAAMRDLMAGVVSTHGTGATAIIPGLELAGKTGTAQKAIPGQGYVDGRYTTLFGCFVPGDAPELLFLVVFDEPKRADGGMVGGGSVCGPVFHEIMWRWMQTGSFIPPDKR